MRVFADPIEIAAAWKRTSKDNTVYRSVKLASPDDSFKIVRGLYQPKTVILLEDGIFS